MDPLKKQKHLVYFYTAVGVVPFVAAFVVILDDDLSISAPSQFILSIYAVAIFSFLGGVYWGVSFASGQISINKKTSSMLLVLGVFPPLLAWLSVTTLQPNFALVVLGGFFILQALGDFALAKKGLLPKWYGMLRIWVSTVVTLILWSAAWIKAAS